MSERFDKEDRGVESSTIGVFRSAKVVKGGKNFAFEALVAAGDKQGNIGIGYGKAKEVPAAVEKATKDARRRMVKIQLAGGTIPHEVMGKFGASAIKLVPADAWKPGTAQDGTAEEDKDVAEITHLMSRAGNWPDGLRWIARRVKPSRRQMRNLTAWEKKTG